MSNQAENWAHEFHKAEQLDRILKKLSSKIDTLEVKLGNDHTFLYEEIKKIHSNQQMIYDKITEIKNQLNNKD